MTEQAGLSRERLAREAQAKETRAEVDEERLLLEDLERRAGVIDAQPRRRSPSRPRTIDTSGVPF